MANLTGTARAPPAPPPQCPSTGTRQKGHALPDNTDSDERAVMVRSFADQLSAINNGAVADKLARRAPRSCSAPLADQLSVPWPGRPARPGHSPETRPNPRKALSMLRFKTAGCAQRRTHGHGLTTDRSEP